MKFDELPETAQDEIRNLRRECAKMRHERNVRPARH